MNDKLVDFVEIYRDEHDEHRWRAMSNNGKIVANSGEGYKNRKDMIEAVVGLFPGVEIRDDDAAY